MQKACRVLDRLERATELYKSVFSDFEQVLDSQVQDSHAISNILKIYFMVKISRESETAETFFYLKEAARVYKEAFLTSWKTLDEDPVGNVINLAQYMMEAKEPTRRSATPGEVVARMIESSE